MKVDTLGERVPYPKQIHQFRQRVQAYGPVLLDVHDEPIVIDDERFENAGIVVLRQPAEVRIAAEIVEQIRADRSPDDIGRIALVALDDVDDLILQTFAFEDPPNRRSAEE